MSSNKIKSLTVSSGLTFWFLLFSSIFNFFKIENLLIFLIINFGLTLLFSSKINNLLDILGKWNTKFFTIIFFISIINLYGMILKILKIDLVRLKTQENSYWLNLDNTDSSRIFKEY